MTAASRLPISVCLISGAEAPRIRRALDSVSGWAGEIIVVLNAEVDDGTDKIAEACGAKVFREPWKGFIAQKNSAAEKCSQPWLLNLDADEEVTPELRAEIQRAVTSPGEHAAFSFPRCTNYFGRWIRHGDWYPDRVTRLWKRGAARWAGEDPHARLEVNGSTGKISGDLLHHMTENHDQQVQKMMRYVDVFVRECAASGKKISVWEVALRPVWRFLRCYFFRLGFLDGRQGLTIAWLGTFYTFLRYSKALEQQRQK